MHSRVLAVVAVLLVGVVAGCARDETPSEDSSLGCPAAPPPKNAPRLVPDGTPTVEIGREVPFGRFSAVVHGLRDPLRPLDPRKVAEGDHLVGVDLEIRNVTGSVQSFNHFQRVFYEDEGGFGNQACPTGHRPDPPNGEIQPGSAIRGQVVFQVRDEASSLRLWLSDQGEWAGVRLS